MLIKSVRQFYILVSGLIAALGLVAVILMLAGDTSGRTLKASLTYRPEGANGLPQVALTFDKNSLPERGSAEAALTFEPALTGDFSWDGSTLLFTPATRPASDTEYRARLRGGLKLAAGGRLSYQPGEWSFHTRPLRVAYLKREGPAVNLWLQEEGPGMPSRRLTAETQRQVLDFSVSPGGERLVYSLQEANQREISLWLIQLPGSPAEALDTTPHPLVYEPNIKASAPRWSPAGDLIAYERRLAFNDGFSPAQLWLVRPDGTSLPPLYGGGDQVGVGLAWTAGGDQAFFWEPRREALGLFNFNGEPSWKALPGLKPESLAPSPEGNAVALARYDYSGAQEQEVLWLLTAGKDKDWQPAPHQPPRQTSFNDRLPAWSPDGKLLTFVRQKAGVNGGRLWVFDPQNGLARPLLDETRLESNYLQGPFQWSPDGQKVLFEKYPAKARSGSEASEIWETDRDGKTLERLVSVSGAFGAKWIG